MNPDIPQYGNEKLIVFDMIGTLTTNPHLISQIFHLTFPSIDVPMVRKYYAKYSVDKISRKTFWRGVGFQNFPSQEAKFLGNITLKQGVLEMLGELKKDYKLALFSNIPKEWGAYLKEKYGFEKVFDGIVFSGDYGLKKPEEKIYNVLINKFQKINPRNMIFVDDDLEDLKTGKEFFMETIWLESAQLAGDFKPDHVIQDIFEIMSIVK